MVSSRKQRARGDPRRRDRSLRSVAGRAAGCAYTGHLRVGDGLAPLPVGSQLDAATGVFTWAPGVGFVGTYDLVFVRWAGARAVARHEVRSSSRRRAAARRRAGGDRHAALATGCRAAVRAGRVGGGSGRGDHHGDRHAARVGVSAGGRCAGVPGHADARRRACRTSRRSMGTSSAPPGSRSPCRG